MDSNRVLWLNWIYQNIIDEGLLSIYAHTLDLLKQQMDSNRVLWLKLNFQNIADEGLQQQQSFVTKIGFTKT